MKSNTPQIRPLTTLDIVTVYGKPFNHSVRGLVAEVDGRIVGIGGIMYSSPIQAFSKICGEELRKHPRLILATARRVADLIDTIDAPVYAIADSGEKNSRRFLEYVGFEFLEDSEKGSVYQWQTQ